MPLPTQEYVNGQPVSTSASFRVYHNVAESIDDHGRLLARSGYYQQAMAERQNPDQFAAALTGVYATDPNYGANLISLMRRYDLYRYGASHAGQPDRGPAVAQPGQRGHPGGAGSRCASGPAQRVRESARRHPAADSDGQPGADPDGAPEPTRTASPQPTRTARPQPTRTATPAADPDAHAGAHSDGEPGADPTATAQPTQPRPGPSHPGADERAGQRGIPLGGTGSPQPAGTLPAGRDGQRGARGPPPPAAAARARRSRATRGQARNRAPPGRPRRRRRAPGPPAAPSAVPSKRTSPG